MKYRFRTLAALALGLTSLALADQNVVINGSMESGPGPDGPDQRVPANWTQFGPTVERSSEKAFAGGWSFKAFGSDPTVGAYQDVACAPGQNVTISAQLTTRASDHVGGDATARVKIEFLNASQQVVGTPQEIVVLDINSPSDVWIPASIGPVAAPAGTAVARMTCVWTYSASSLGSAYWDACSLTINGGANQLLNSGFETAGVGTGFNPTGIDHWNGFGGQEKSDEQAFHGQFSARVEGSDDAGSFSGLYQDTADLEAGDRLFVQSFVYNPAGTGLSGSASAAIKLEFFPSGGSDIPPAEENLEFDTDDPTDTWVTVSYATEVPEDITLARIVLLANDVSASNGPVYMDSASATRSTTGSTNHLLNASFESGSSGPNGLTSWTEFRGPLCSARKNAFEVPATNGSSVLKISGSCVAGVYQEIEVTPGEILTISAMVRQTSGAPFNSDPASMAGVKVEWRAGNIPPQVDIGGAPNNTILAGAPTNQWIPIWIDYTMPAGSAARVRTTLIIARGSATFAEVYFDGFEAVVRDVFDGADSDFDDDQDMLDFAELQRCFEGPGAAPAQWNCIVFDSDEDEDIDLVDWNFFWPRITGP